MKKGLLLFVLMIGLAGTVAAQTRVLNPTLQKSTVQKPIVEKPALQKPLSAQASVTLRFPNGGERMAPGSRQVIQWKAVGPVPALRIELLRNGSRVQTLTETYPATKGQFVWQVGRIQPGRGYSIRIVAAGGLASTSKPFSIIASASTGLLQDAPSPVKGSSGSETKVAKPWFKADQRVEEASPPLVPSTGRHSFFEDKESPQESNAPVVTYGGGQDSPYQGRLEKNLPETKLPEQPGAWYKEFAETPARQENLPMAGMQTERVKMPDFEVRAITFDPETRRLNIQIANCGEKDYLDAPLELSWKLYDLGPYVLHKDNISLRKNEEKPWVITLENSWRWPIDKGRLRCDVTVDPNDTILESNEDNNRHALWLYKSSGPDVNLAADHLLVGLRERAFYSTQHLELEPEDVHAIQDQEHVCEVDIKVPLVNCGDQATSGVLLIFAPGVQSHAVMGYERVSLQKGEMRWIVKRWVLGTPSPAYNVPFTFAWENDDHVIFQGDLEVSSALFEQLGSLPDLHPSSIGSRPTNPAGTPHRVYQPYSFHVGVRNIGGDTDKTFRLLVEVTGPGGDVVYRMTDVIQGLDHLGLKDNLQHEFTPETSGHYTIRLKADSERDVREYNEDNNEHSRDFRIYGESTDSDDRVP